MLTNGSRSACVGVSLALCRRRGSKARRKPHNCRACAVRLVCTCTVETSGTALAELWNSQRGKKKESRKKSLKCFRSHLEQIPSGDRGTVKKPRFTVALPRGRTGFRNKPCGKLPRAADLWGQAKNKVVQFIRAALLGPCLHQPHHLPCLPAPSSPPGCASQTK